MSSRVAKILRAAGWTTRADLTCDQVADACGFIAADAAVRLRDAALAEPDGWASTALPDYSTEASVRRGEAALGRPASSAAEHANRVLEVAHVNELVRSYANLTSDTQSQEEWWGGAIALDYFLEGALEDFLDSARAPGHRSHKWRVRVVNTQSSRHAGSHWFTVAVGLACAAEVALATEQRDRDDVAPSPLLFPDAAAPLRAALALVATAQEGGDAFGARRACEA